MFIINFFPDLSYWFPVWRVRESWTAVPHTLHWGEASFWPLSHRLQMSGVLQWWLSFCKSPISTRNLCSSTLMNWVLGHLSYQCLSFLIAQFDWGGKLYKESWLLQTSSIWELWRSMCVWGGGGGWYDWGTVA